MLRIKAEDNSVVNQFSSVLFSSDGVSAVKSMILLNINCILNPAGRAKADSGLVLLYKRNTLCGLLRCWWCSFSWSVSELEVVLE